MYFMLSNCNRSNTLESKIDKLKCTLLCDIIFFEVYKPFIMAHERP